MCLLTGTRILVHKNINVGMAVSLPNYNLIVPVIKNADQKNLFGILFAMSLTLRKEHGLQS